MICTLYLVLKNVAEAERSAAEMLRLAKLNESLVDLEIATQTEPKWIVFHHRVFHCFEIILRSFSFISLRHLQ